jgi:hypothetical protein
VSDGSLEKNSGLGGTAKATLIAAVTKAVLNSLSPRVHGSNRAPRGLV